MPVARDKILNEIARIGAVIALGVTNHLLSDCDMVSHFGATPDVVHTIWFLIHQEPARFKVPSDGTELKHVLWTLHFAKNYSKKKNIRKQYGVSYKTFNRYELPIRHAMGKLLKDVIKWENRKLGRAANDPPRTCLVTVDGTDCAIQEPPKTDDSKLPFDKKWYSHKLNGAGVRYEVAVCIKTGDIVWVNGPYACGKYPDIVIFQDRLVNMLDRDEKVEADRGYVGDSKVRTPDAWVNKSERRAKAVALARHETVNGRLKNFAVLNQKFRHDRMEHKYFFSLAATITQLMFEYHGNTFDVRY